MKPSLVEREGQLGGRERLSAGRPSEDGSGLAPPTAIAIPSRR